jgi:hypothetical protein
VTVWVERVSGDVDLRVAAGSRRVFTRANYATPQPVTLSAALDADSLHGTAKFRCSALGYLNAQVNARERDRDIPRLAVAPAQRAVGSAAGRTSFAVSNAGRGRLTYATRSSASWLRIVSGGSGTNRGRIALAYTANRSARPRTGTVTVTARGVSGSPVRVRVVQSGRPSLQVSPALRAVGSEAGTATFAVTNRGDGAVRYTATSSAAWLSIQTGARGTNGGTVGVAFTPNLSATARTGTITVAASGAAGSPQRVRIVQAANPPVLSVDPEEYAYGEIPIGTAAEVVFTVENQGGGTLTGSATVPAPFWIVSGGAYRLGPDQRQEVKVRYSPAAAGVHQAEIRFTGAGEVHARVTGNASWVPAVHVKLNSGGEAAAGWAADENWTGTPSASAGTNAVTIAHAADVPQAVYQTRRNAQTLDYDLPIPDGRYDVRLHFSEPYWAATGQRVFDIEIEGTTVRTNFDILAVAGGRHRAVVLLFEGIEVTDGLQIRGLASVGVAQFNGIEAWSAEPPPEPPAPPAPASAKRTPPAAAVFRPSAQARSGQDGWAAAPELVDGDPDTLWRGVPGAATWAVALDFEEALPLKNLDILYETAPWPAVSVMGATEPEAWFELDPDGAQPIDCRFLYLQFLDDGSGAAPALRELEWEEALP